jgi:hypothetical protein
MRRKLQERKLAAGSAAYPGVRWRLSRSLGAQGPRAPAIACFLSGGGESYCNGTIATTTAAAAAPPTSIANSISPPVDPDIFELRSHVTQSICREQICKLNNCSCSDFPRSCWRRNLSYVAELGKRDASNLAERRKYKGCLTRIGNSSQVADTITYVHMHVGIYT